MNMGEIPMTMLMSSTRDDPMMEKQHSSFFLIIFFAAPLFIFISVRSPHVCHYYLRYFENHSKHANFWVVTEPCCRQKAISEILGNKAGERCIVCDDNHKYETCI